MMSEERSDWHKDSRNDFEDQVFKLKTQVNMPTAIFPTTEPTGWQSFTCEDKVLVANFPSFVHDAKHSTNKTNVFTAKVYKKEDKMTIRVLALVFLIMTYALVHYITLLMPFIPRQAVWPLLLLSYAPVAMAFHALRIPVVVLYILGHAIVDIAKGKGIKKTLSSHGWAILKQGGHSLWGIVKSPFYGLKFTVGLGCCLIHPRMGYKFVGDTESGWNREIHPRQALSIRNLTHWTLDGFTFEGGGDIETMEPNIACLLPSADSVGTITAEVSLNQPTKYTLIYRGEKHSRTCEGIEPDSSWS